MRLTVPALHIDARGVPVGVDRNQDVAIPADVHTLGWYRYGAAPGDPNGSIVVVGHVDSATQGLGTFFELHTVPARATVVVHTPATDACGAMRSSAVGST